MSLRFPTYCTISKVFFKKQSYFREIIIDIFKWEFVKSFYFADDSLRLYVSFCHLSMNLLFRKPNKLDHLAEKNATE